MQTIHVLRTKKAASSFLEFSQSQVCGVGLGIASAAPPFRVVLPDQLRIATPCVYIRELIVAVPSPVSALKYRNPALRADSCAGEDERDGRA